MNLSKNKPKFYLILFTLLVFAVYYHFFLSPILTETRIYQRDISVYQDSMTAVENKQVKIKDIQSKRHQLQIALSEKQAKLPEQLDSYDLIHLLFKAHANKLNRHSLIFLEPVSRGDFYVIPVRFSFSTDNKGLLDFLSGLEGLPDQPTISYMQISADEVTENDQNNMDDHTKVRYNLDIEMTLNFYVKGIGE